MNKGYFILFAILLFCMTVFPLAATSKNTESKSKTVPSESQTAVKDDGTFKVKQKSGEIQNIDILEYTCGVTAAEIDIDYNTEALKAQAVAAYTLALYRKYENKSKDYDITDSSKIDQRYISRDERQKKWGDSFEKNEKKLQNAVSDVLFKKITYNGKVILSVYFDLSGGKTESAKNVWGADYAYLQPVESVGDMLSPEYISTVTYTIDEFKSICASMNLTLEHNPEKWLGSAKCSDSGTVLSQKIGNSSFSGTKIRTAFNLRSANFNLKYQNTQFVFTVRGYGHCVGMSQYGANYLAKSGSTYQDILKWYYNGVKIE